MAQWCRSRVTLRLCNVRKCLFLYVLLWFLKNNIVFQKYVVVSVAVCRVKLGVKTNRKVDVLLSMLVLVEKVVLLVFVSILYYYRLLYIPQLLFFVNRYIALYLSKKVLEGKSRKLLVLFSFYRISRLLFLFYNYSKVMVRL